jgi:hypothetical protein
MPDGIQEKDKNSDSSRSPVRNLNVVAPEQETGVLPS